MRVIVLTLALLLAGTARAQYPGGWSYAPTYPPPPGYVVRPPVNPVSISAEMLHAHNAVRRRVGVPLLVWSNRLSATAQQWADHLLSSNSFSHRQNNRYGENLYMISGGSVSPSQVVAAWSGEVRDYDIRTNTCASVCGHYTQIVWARSRAVGCAVTADQHRQIWVCNYDPPGNVVGFRPY